MKRSAWLIGILLLFVWLVSGCSENDNGDTAGDGSVDNGAALRMGLLQFRTRHNLQDNACLPDDCYLKMEDEEDIGQWLDHLQTISNMAVLHWDRSIPWLAFDENPPQGVDRVAFFDQRIDRGLLAWINAFRAYFEQMPSGYLAVSLLNGQRIGIQACRVDEDTEVDVAGACPVLAPGSQMEFQYDSDTGPVTAGFDLERSYTNFVMYLYDKLKPDYLALMVEINLFKVMQDPCPDHWDGLVRLYRSVYDTVRPQVAGSTKVFATVTLQQLLGYVLEDCHGPLKFESCTGTPAPADYAEPDPQTCYPLDSSIIEDLDQGDRLEVLALSFYPDALVMDVADDNLISLYAEEWDGTGDCVYRAQAAPYLDPTAALDRLNWTKPIAIAELGARSDRTIQYNGGYWVQPPADSTSQSFWLNLFIGAAVEHQYEFYIQSFSNDFEAIGPWTVRADVLDSGIYSLFNNFAYMGVYNSLGMQKTGVTEMWMTYLSK